jgi:hypothetical protein
VRVFVCEGEERLLYKGRVQDKKKKEDKVRILERERGREEKLGKVISKMIEGYATNGGDLMFLRKEI